MEKVGIITGLTREARCLPAPGDARFPQIAFSGANSDAASAAAGALIERGCDALLSFGLAGGLDPTLPPGTILLPHTVICPDGKSYTVDEDWRNRVEQALAGNTEICPAPITGSDAMVADKAAKSALFGRTGAAAVDMESHRVAAESGLNQIPFLVLRVIADPAERSLPAWMGGIIGQDGRLRPGPLAAGLFRHPMDVGKLIALGRDAQRASLALSRVASRVADLIGFG